MANKLRKKTTQVQKIVKKSKLVQPTTSFSNKTQARPQIALPQGTYWEGVGRRKVATARVRIYNQPGDYIINDMAAGQYFSGVHGAAVKFNQPLKATDSQGKFTIFVKVQGSGLNAQLDAVALGLSRALIKYDANFKTLLKGDNLLTRDDRMKETRKVGMGGKARRQRQSPKR